MISDAPDQRMQLQRWTTISSILSSFPKTVGIQFAKNLKVAKESGIAYTIVRVCSVNRLYAKISSLSVLFITAIIPWPF